MAMRGVVVMRIVRPVGGSRRVMMVVTAVAMVAVSRARMTLARADKRDDRRDDAAQQR